MQVTPPAAPVSRRRLGKPIGKGKPICTLQLSVRTSVGTICLGGTEATHMVPLRP